MQLLPEHRSALVRSMQRVHPHRRRSSSLAWLVVPAAVFIAPQLSVFTSGAAAFLGPQLRAMRRVASSSGAALQEPARKRLCATALRSVGVATAVPELILEKVSLQAKLQDAFQEAISSALPSWLDMSAQLIVADPKFGDYQCNNAMAAFKKMKQAKDFDSPYKSPRDVGMAIKDALPESASDFIEDAVVAPQGFITVKLRQSYLEAELQKMYAAGMKFSTEKPQRIVIDYSSPNVAKEMHVGHLRSTILGDTVANLLEGLGHDVKRLNHVGDWGTQFGMLLEYLRRHGEESKTDEGFLIKDLQQFYRSAKEEFDADDSFKKAAQLNVVALQSGEEWARESWMSICEASRKEFQEVYGRLGIQGLEERGESFYNEMLPDIVEQLTACGLIEESDGAKCIFTSASKAPLIVQKADGGFGYDSTDLAAVKHRLDVEAAERIIYVVDNGQESHFRMIFEAADKAGWQGGRQLDFMGFGLVQGADGKKFKTRSGDVVRLRDLLDEAASRAGEELRRRAGAAAEAGAESSEQPAVDDEQIEKDAEDIGVAAVKYFDLRQNRNSDYRFSFDSVLDPKGNTAVYVLYAYARICAILRRSSVEPRMEDLALAEPAERALALRLARLPEILKQVEDDLLPSRLIDYIYGLSSDFTSFYTSCPVVGSDVEASRVALCEMTRSALEACLRLLRIRPLEQL